MNNISGNEVELSVIIPITERYDSVKELFALYKNDVEKAGMAYEFIYVLDGQYPEVLDELVVLKETEKLTIITLAKWFGEATALSAAFKQAAGNLILTLPAYQQVEAGELSKLFAAIGDHDMALARRWPRKDSLFNRFQARTFNFMLRSFADLRIHDAGCGVRLFTREVIDEVQIYGDLFRFLPVMARRQGFRITEINVEQAQRDAFRRIYSPGIYIRRLLDLLTIFFLFKFTKKPLRFFGLVGTALFGLGALVTAYLVGERLFFDVALANRPALILGSLLVVLGIQIIAIGLIGEIIIFTHARELKEYKVDRIIN